jgi:hypothetical protein
MDLTRNSGLDPVTNGLLIELESLCDLGDGQKII